jgi:hypothetical protein
MYHIFNNLRKVIKKKEEDGVELLFPIGPFEYNQNLEH